MRNKCNTIVGVGSRVTSFSSCDEGRKFKGFKVVVLCLFDLFSLITVRLPWFPGMGRVAVNFGLENFMDVSFPLVGRCCFCNYMYITFFQP